METTNPVHRRRPRYKGTHPTKFSEKYKELNPEKYAETAEHVIKKGGTPAGMHIPICVKEILEFLRIQPVADSLHRLVIIVNPCHTLSQIEKGKKPVLCPILLEEDLIILPVRLIMNSLYAEPQFPDHSSVILISIVVPSVLAGPVGCGESGELRIDIVIIPIAVSNREKILPIRLKPFYLINVTTFKPRYETVIDINIGIYAPLCRLIGYSRTIRRRIQRQSKQ